MPKSRFTPGKTPAEQVATARPYRMACRPLECPGIGNGDVPKGCWVEVGPPGCETSGGGGRPHCRTCGGKIRAEMRRYA